VKPIKTIAQSQTARQPDSQTAGNKKDHVIAIHSLIYQKKIQKALMFRPVIELQSSSQGSTVTVTVIKPETPRALKQSAVHQISIARRHRQQKL
jgi:hypothetical protein